MPYSHQCPQCQKPVDPLRARAIALIDGQFLYFCSSSCRERQRAGREQTLEVTAMQILDGDESKQIQILKDGEIEEEPAHEGGNSLGRLAIMAILVLLTAGGVVFWLIPRL